MKHIEDLDSSIYKNNLSVENITQIKTEFNNIEKTIYKQDHNYKLVIYDCSIYSNHISFYFKCIACGCLLIRMTTGEYKFNFKYDDNSTNDIEDINKFLTCSEMAIKNIIE
jgi:hypothetical protein